MRNAKLKLTSALLFPLSLIALAGCDHPAMEATTTQPASGAVVGKVVHTDAEWKKLLTPDQYYILREKGTEPPFHNAYYDNHATGTYVCAADGNLLFTTDTKYDSKTGWPSFFQAATDKSVDLSADEDGSRTEVLCHVCGGHLGHVFDDGPAPTGKRFCMNSGAMRFVAAGEKK